MSRSISPSDDLLHAFAQSDWIKTPFIGAADITIPPDFLQHLQKIYQGEILEACLAALGTTSPSTFTVNALKITREEIWASIADLALSVEPISWYNSTYLISAASKTALTHSSMFNRGEIYVQNLSSLLPVWVLNPSCEDQVLDLTASPGGKCFHMALKMGNQGRIAAVEAVKSRFFKLMANLSRYGVNNVKYYHADGRHVGGKCPERFDKILLDAPCSADTRIRLNAPDTWRYWHPKKTIEMASKQKQLLLSAAQALKPLGEMVYCTCAYGPEENEAVIDWLLRRYPYHFEVNAVNLPVANRLPGFAAWCDRQYHPGVQKAWRILANEQMRGFFLCKITKTRSMDDIAIQ